MNNLIEATTIHTATKSLTIQFFYEKYHPKQQPNPTVKLIPSITLISNPLTLKPFLRKSSLIKKITSLKHKATAKVPTIHDKTYTTILTASILNTATIPPIIKMIPNTMING